MYLPEVNSYQLELISPVTWETVDRIRMGETEQIISLKTVELASKETTSGRKSFVAVGTGFMRSEELACRGRVLYF
jgi:cleavage and polyadenylation specificity factor subunit 1